MAYGENPTDVYEWTIDKTNLAFDSTAPYGNENAGKNLMLGYDGDLVGDGEAILGGFLDVDKNQSGSVLMGGKPMIMRQKAQDGCTVGSKVVGAGDGQVKNAATAAARGRVIKVLENTANGRVLVWMP